MISDTARSVVVLLLTDSSWYLLSLVGNLLDCYSFHRLIGAASQQQQSVLNCNVERSLLLGVACFCALLVAPEMAQAAVVRSFFPVIISILVALVVVVQGATDPQDGTIYLHPSHVALSSCLYALLQTCLRITEWKLPLLLFIHTNGFRSEFVLTLPTWDPIADCDHCQHLCFWVKWCEDCNGKGCSGSRKDWNN